MFCFVVVLFKFFFWFEGNYTNIDQLLQIRIKKEGKDSNHNIHPFVSKTYPLRLTSKSILEPMNNSVNAETQRFIL